MILRFLAKPVCLMLLLVFSGGAFQAANAQDESKVDFVKQIQPIFEMHCVRCHGEVDPENMRMDEHESVMDYVEAEDSENSMLFELINSEDDDRMPPPDDGDPLSKEQIALVAQWIDEGAEWPEGLVLADRSEELNETGNQDKSQGEAKMEKDDDTAATSDEQNQEGDDQGEDDQGESEDDQATGQESSPRSPLDNQPAGQKAEKDPDTVYWAIGSLHPAAVHLPIGLLMAAGLFGLLGLRGNFVMSDCAYYCLWLGTFGCIAACVSGWWFSPMEKVGTVTELSDLWDQNQRVFWHRTSGLAVSVFALFLSLMAAGARNRNPDEGVMWKLGTILLAVGVAWAGHKGGELTHGKQHYRHLNTLFNSFFEKDDAAEEGLKLEDEGQKADATGTEFDKPDVKGRDGKGRTMENLGLGRDI